MKDLFLLDPSVVFLNHGAFGACPAPVLEAYQAWQRELERNPVEFLGRRSGELLAGARAALADHLGARAEDLVFVPNATHAVNAVARSIALAPGDEVVTSDQEYGACEATWAWVCRRAGARLLKVPLPLPLDAGAVADRLLGACGPRTRLLFLSHLTSTTALRLPVEEVCRRARAAGVPTLVDGAHAPGQLPLALDALGADFYAGNCHKWLCAPKGAGFLHARPEHHAGLEGTVVSWGYLPADDDPARLAYTGASPLERRLQWQGTRDLAAFLAVPAAIAFQRSHRWDRVRAACHALAAEALARVGARSGLPPIGGDADFAQMVAVPVPPRDPAALQAALLARRIEVPVTGHGGRLFVRVSVQAYNDRADVDALVEALADLHGWRAP